MEIRIHALHLGALDAVKCLIFTAIEQQKLQSLLIDDRNGTDENEFIETYGFSMDELKEGIASLEDAMKRFRD